MVTPSIIAALTSYLKMRETIINQELADLYKQQKSIIVKIKAREQEKQALTQAIDSL